MPLIVSLPPAPMRVSDFVMPCAFLLLAGCASAPAGNTTASGIPGSKPANQIPNFAGHWEKNYQASDNFNSRFQLYIADIQRRMTRADLEQAPFAVNGGLNADAINGLARFTEEITRMPLLEIKQDDTLINVERETDFNLRCKFTDPQAMQSRNAFGAEACGWNQDRLVFRMTLSGGLHITHQLALSRDGSQLNLTTTLSTDQVNTPLIVSNYYTRFESQEDKFDCQQTLTRNKVCTQGAAGK